MSENVSTAVAKVEKPTPGSMVRASAADFAAVLPTHIKSSTWVRLAQGALKKGKKVQIKVDGELVKITELELAALNNPGVFMASLLDAARLGLEPGTEQYYLTPRKVKGQLEILGIVGYQGIIELIYRAGAVSSVIAECVHVADTFVYRPGALDTENLAQGKPPRWEGPQRTPFHDINWDLDDRGDLRLVYAYAVMRDGATSKVVVLNKAAIARIKASSAGANYDSSPWKTHEPAMWLKSAVRQLAKWVPTSAEYVRLPGAAAVESGQPMGVPQIEGGGLAAIDTDGDAEVVDGELVDDDPRAADLKAAWAEDGVQ